ncbi:MAG: aminomethyl-transferring glycine dehydrogenase subunit GcvPA, partial [Spirochaetota bacterium]
AGGETMLPYLPHTAEDISSMLSAVGAGSLEELFFDLPAEVKLTRPLNLPDGISEYEVTTRLKALAGKNRSEYICFLGCGTYDHIIPAAVHHLVSRSEFYTAYTPYQAEISQGILQAIFEFQTMICELTSLDASNASLYDGHTAACEAAVIALNSVHNSNTILYSAGLHPFTKQVLRTHFSGLGVALREVKLENGTTSIKDLKAGLSPGVAAVIVQNPNFLGYLEDYSGFGELIRENQALFVVSSNPMSLGILKSPGEWGADIAIGDIQPFGLPSYFGGPSAGYIAAREKFLRKMPGRIVGQSLDCEGRRAFLLTLQAREQHIRRERATSNICSNQALAALTATVYLSLLGKQGLEELGRQNTQKAHYLFERLIRELPVKPLYDQPFFNEFPVVLNQDAESVLNRMLARGLLGGIALRSFYPDDSLRQAVEVAVTEKRSREELDLYVDTLKEILQ